MPDFSFETVAKAQGARIIAGVDEVGRGPLAGPVTAAAVILGEVPPEGLDDSKKLSAKKREALAEKIFATSRVSVVHVSVEEIDEHNILRASHIAMERAIAELGDVDHILVDGNLIPSGFADRSTEAIVKGDARSLSIAAASIVAKTRRDALMCDLAQQFPGYGWERNAGYGTAEHRKALLDLGITPFHRRSFAPIRNML